MPQELEKGNKGGRRGFGKGEKKLIMRFIALYKCSNVQISTEFTLVTANPQQLVINDYHCPEIPPPTHTYCTTLQQV